MNHKKSIGLTYNSPVVLTFLLISLQALIINYISGGIFNILFSSNISLLNPLSYIRLFSHVICHAGWEHFFSNMLLFILIGPLLEEKYGSKELLIMIAITSAVTAIINSIFFPNTVLIGASGIVFMFIVLSSFTSIKNREIPLTFIFVLLMYLGNEILNGLFVEDNISQLSHILGGLCGAVFGFLEKNN